MNIKVDPAMMAALMAACSVIQTGANTEEVILIMVMDGDDNIMILRWQSDRHYVMCDM